MMNLVGQIESAVEKATKKLWPDIELSEIDVVTPPNPEFGDYSCAVALAVAKELKTNPMEIATQLKNELGEIEMVKKITVTEPGFVNFIIDYQALAKSVLESNSKFQIPDSKFQNIVIEHTSVNPNKAAHIGHLRNACLGDSLSRLMKSAGHKVEVQNYIDDLGLQVADSVVAFETFGDAPENTPVDKWFWKIYADIQKKYEGQPELQKRRDEILQEMEEGKSETAKQIVKRIVDVHLKTFCDFDIKYDLLVYEHDIVRNHLWDKLFEELKTKQLITQAASGDSQGAWLVKFGQTDREDKILVRSSGVPTYTAKDIAYQLWKFGSSEMPGYKRKFKKVNEVINVIDERQSYPQSVIKHVLGKLGYKKEADNSVHLGYGVVKLSEKAMVALGEAAGDKMAYSMSGRAGIGVMVDDLLDAAIAAQIKEHDTQKDVARQIAVGSIRYYMLKTRPQREIIFDFDEALKTDGNTGVYLQYAYARASNILKKAAAGRPELSSANSPQNISPERSRRATLASPLTPPEKALIKILSEMPATVTEATSSYDPSLLCDYAYALATCFAKFYETTPVLQAGGKAKPFRLALVKNYLRVLGQVLDILEVPKLSKI